MEREVIETRIVHNPDGSARSTYTKRITDTPKSGLLEAWGFLILIMATFLLFFFTYRIVSNITHKESNNGFQRNEQYQNQ